MNLQSKKFAYKGRDLEVRARPAQDGWKVRVYEDGRPVTGVIYSVSYETEIDARLQRIPADLVNELMNVAQSDIEQERVQLV